MHTKKQLLVWLIIGVSFAGCEMPKKPDFKTSHKVEAPVMYKKTLQFMGDSTGFSMIDTTSSDFDSLFVFNDDNTMSISKEQDFEFGDLNDAVPVVNVDPTAFTSEVGEIKLGAFSSGGGNLGTASFQELTGQNPSLVPAGTPIIAGSTPNPVTILIGDNTDYFVSATVKSGALTLGVTNNLGFNISKITVVLFSGSSQVGSVDLVNVNNGQTTSDDIIFSEGDVLSDINVQVSVEWNAQTTQAEPGELVVENAEGKDLVASQVEAVIAPQAFKTESITKIDSSDFLFDDPSQFIELKSGEIAISPIQNSIDVTVESMVISFPGIRKPPFGEGDSLVIEYSGSTEISRNGNAPARTIDLSGYRIFATNNQLTYNIDAKTEDTQAGAGSEARTITENDKVSSSIAINNLTIKRATGIIKRQNVLLNDDEGSDEHLDLFNDNEAEITNIDGLTDISSQLKNIDFTNPTLSINYFSNISVPTTIYGAFIGTNGDGEQVFLKGVNSSKYTVQPSDSVTGLYANGVKLRDDQLIKFSLEEITNEAGADGTPIEFNRTNTNVNDFLNNLPNEIRFVGKAVINQDEQEATILDNLIFDPKISIDIPLAFKTEQAATYTDTVEQDLGDVPSKDNGDTRSITEGIISIDYENGLPLSVDLSVVFMDSLHNEFESIPVAGEKINLMASEVDQTTRFATNKTSGTIRIALNEDQLRQLYKTRFLKISAELLTTDTSGNGEGNAVRLRTTDSITLTVRAELSIESDINLDD
jgi:hypothetical protein